VGFRNKQADALIEKLRATFDQEERDRLFRELHRIIHDEQPYTFFFYQKFVFCWRDSVKNVTFAKDRPPDSYFPWWVATE
jgi:ABC-type transport system substrate-binding protein